MVASIQGTIVIPKASITPKMRKAYTYVVKGFSGPEVYYSFTEDKHYGYFSRNLQKFRRYSSLPFEYNLVEGKEIEGGLRKGYVLRDYQQGLHDEVLKALESDINVFFQAGTRYGKTFTSCSMLSKLGKSTLVVVDKILLVDQFVSDFKEYSTFDVGVLHKDKELHDITVTTFQYLNANPKLLKEIKGEFGVLLIDEAHGSSATTYMGIIESIPSRYRISMSATPSRSDGKSGMLYDMLGEVSISGSNPGELTPRLEVVTLPKAYFPSPYNPKASLKKFLKDIVVVTIVNSIITSYLKKGKSVLVATDLIEIQELYAPTTAINSNMKKERRQEVIEGFNDGSIKLISGLGTVTKGVTLPRLEVILNLSGPNNKESITQLLGRLKSPFECGKEKDPVFVDIIPKNSSWKDTQRERLLKELTT